MMAKRFIKLYEQIVNWEWFQHPNTLALFIYLLLKANYKDGNFQGRTIQRGQLVTSLPKIATGTGLTIRQTRTALEHLKSTGEVTDESSNQYRIITIVKYDDYQSSTDELTGNRQATDRRVDRQPTDEATPSIEYIEYIEKDRKNRTIEREGTAKRFTPPTKDEILQFCQENGLSIDVDYFIDHYNSNGWLIGGKSKMKDWRATVRNWARRDRKAPVPAQSKPQRILPAQDFQQRDYSGVKDEMMSDLAREMAEAKRRGEV